jgi:heme/copper-type cytochrome/quinol oxidase subunit 1
MLLAKSFAALGVVLAVAAAIGAARLLPWDAVVHGTYFVLSPSLVFWFCSLTSVTFAILYWAAEKFVPTRWSRTLGALHFLLFSSFAILFTVLAVAMRFGESSHPESLSWIVIPWLLGILSFLLGLLLFFVNLVLTLIRTARARLAVH